MACIGGASQQNVLFSTNVPPKNVSMPSISRIGPVYIIYMFIIYIYLYYIYIYTMLLYKYIYIYIYIYIHLYISCKYIYIYIYIYLKFLECSCCFVLFIKIKKGYGTSFQCRFCVYLFNKNVPYQLYSLSIDHVSILDLISL